MSFSKLLCASCDYGRKWKLGRNKELCDAKWSLFFHCVRKHMVVSDNDKLICDACNLPSVANKDLWKHIYISHLNQNGENSFICENDKCHLQFYPKGNFQTHIVMQHLLKDIDVGQFSCDQCSYSSRWIGALGQHIRECHLYICLRFPCNECARVLYTQRALMKHKRSKHRYQLVCEVCGMNTSEKGNLMVHIQRKHNRNRNIVIK